MLNFIELTDSFEVLLVLGTEVLRQVPSLYQAYGVLPEIGKAIEFFLPHSRPVGTISGS